jgi:hypothetical protein
MVMYRRADARRRQLVVMVAIALFAQLPLLTFMSSPAEAVVSKYRRKDFSNGNGLRTWGYLHDNCIGLVIACNVGGRANVPTNPKEGLGVIRPEATAQTIAMFTHAALRGDLPDARSPGSLGYTEVDWEVGPRGTGAEPDTASATNPGEPPGEPGDPCEPGNAGGVYPNDRYRIDIVVGKSTLIEVKDVKNVAMVDNQLNCYIERAQTAGLSLARDPLLNVSGPIPLYVVPYLDSSGGVWCTWGPPSAGHLYFARIGKTPPTIATQCAAPALAPAMIKKQKEQVEEVLANKNVDKKNIDGRIAPAITPVYSKTKPLRPVTYSIAAEQHASIARTLQIDFGDGSDSLFITVPAGDGIIDATRTKSYSKNGRYTQRATLFDTDILTMSGEPSAAKAAASESTLVFETTTDVGMDVNDFDGDGKSDFTIYRPTVGGWHINQSSGGTFSKSWGGIAGDVPVLGDYDGDGLSDPTIYRPSSGSWSISRSSDETTSTTYLGGFASDIPVTGDFDGSGTTDVAVFRDGAWHVNGQSTVYLGLAGDVPVPGDYDGNGTTDRAVFRNGVWHIEGRSVTYFGLAGDTPVPGDYNGDGKTDIAVYRPDTGAWFIHSGSPSPVYWGGASGDVPVPGDYNGDGKTDIAVYRPGTGGWYVNGGNPGLTYWGGIPGDVPVTGLVRSFTITQPEIAAKWQALGGPSGVLGRLTSNTTQLPCSSGRYNTFAGGLIIWTAESGARAIYGPIRDKWVALGSFCGDMGLPLEDQKPASSSGAGVAQVFAKGSIYSSIAGTAAVRGAIRNEYDAIGAGNSVLGFPVSDEQPTAYKPGRWQGFQNGSIYSSSAGTVSIHGSILAKYASKGHEGGPLGFPTTRQYPTTHKPGIVQAFEGGYIYMSSHGTYELHGMIASKYAAMGYEGGVLGFPKNDETPTSCLGAKFNVFENGYIHARADLGAFATYGAIGQKWWTMGYECSYLGMPMSDEFTSYGAPPYSPDGSPTGRHQQFQGAGIFWNKNSGQTHAYGDGGASGFYSNFDRSQLLLDGPDQRIDFDWGGASPGPNVPSEYWQAEWRTRLWVPQDGYYTFYTESDDGVDLIVCPSEKGLFCSNPNGSTDHHMIDNWTDHAATEDISQPVFLKRGSHETALFYYQAAGGSTLRLSWSGPNIPKQIIPRENLDPSLRAPT